MGVGAELRDIPKSWTVEKLGQLASLRTGPFGSSLHKADYVADGIPLINPMHIVDDQLAPDDDTSVSSDAARRLSPYRLRADDIVMGRRGEIGRCAVVNESQSGWLCGTGSLIIRCHDETDAAFLVRVLRTERIVNAITDSSVGSTMINLNQAALSKLLIQRPPADEQRAIAAALSDADALLDSLDALIAKKQAIKLATMQQLLTGKMRLPGFRGEWTREPLKGIADIYSGATPSTQVAGFWSGSIPWCTPSDITATRGKFLTDTGRSITTDALASCAAGLLPAGALLLCTRATVGEVKIAAIPVCTNQGFKSLVCKAGISSEFLYYVLLTLKPRLLEKAIGSTFLEVGMRDVAALSVHLPPIGEQTAIATVLADMDADIDALERRRDKMRSVKQGMMQQLLSGRMRLVAPGVSAGA